MMKKGEMHKNKRDTEQKSNHSQIPVISNN